LSCSPWNKGLSKYGKPICVDCGGPRSVGSGQRCKSCYKTKAAIKRFLKMRLRTQVPFDV
jgi:hypothetical protein